MLYSCVISPLGFRRVVGGSWAGKRGRPCRRGASQCCRLLTKSNLEPSQIHCARRSSIDIWTALAECGRVHPTEEARCSRQLASVKLMHACTNILKGLTNHRKISQECTSQLNWVHLVACWLTLSYSCSWFKLARPPTKRELPRTSKRLDKIDPTKEHFTTSIFPWYNANRAMISSVAFPHVAFSSPPTRLMAMLN